MLGLSTRKVGEVLLALLGRNVSASTVRRVAKTLDAAVAAFHARPLDNAYKALMLDGAVLARKTGAGALRCPVLVALGIHADGLKEIVDRYPTLAARKQVRTTNAIERRFREVRRRTRPIGTFQDRTSKWTASSSPSSHTKTNLGERTPLSA